VMCHLLRHAPLLAVVVRPPTAHLSAPVKEAMIVRLSSEMEGVDAEQVAASVTSISPETQARLPNAHHRGTKALLSEEAVAIAFTEVKNKLASQEAEFTALEQRYPEGPSRWTASRVKSRCGSTSQSRNASSSSQCHHQATWCRRPCPVDWIRRLLSNRVVQYFLDYPSMPRTPATSLSVGVI
jgi:hypothetical protein